ncbi:MAG: hypothetical protein KGL95_14215 [Patescibacteria group bacterium]|nr:hypothetical protein [Patescibacteria group bacterium]
MAGTPPAAEIRPYLQTLSRLLPDIPSERVTGTDWERYANVARRAARTLRDYYSTHVTPKTEDMGPILTFLPIFSLNGQVQTDTMTPTQIKRTLTGLSLSAEQQDIERVQREGMPPEQRLAATRRFVIDRQLLFRAAEGLEDTIGYEHEPGQHAPSILPALREWYSGRPQTPPSNPTNHAVIGAITPISAVHMSQMIHAVDPSARVTVYDLEEIPVSSEEQKTAGFTFTRGNVLTPEGLLTPNSVDTISSHLLFYGANQLRTEPTSYSTDAHGIVSPAVPEDQKPQTVASAFKSLYNALRPGGEMLLAERIDPQDATQTEKIRRALEWAGFRREDVTISPINTFTTVRATDAFFDPDSSYSFDINHFVTGYRRSSPLIEPDPGLSLIVAKKSPQQ